MEHDTKIMRYTTHPMLLIAAIAVVLFCGIGIAAIMGWLPQSGASMGPPVAQAPVQVGQQDMGPPPPPADALAGASGGGSYGGGSYGGGGQPPAALAAAGTPAGYRAPVEHAAAPTAPAAAPAPAPAICRSCGVVESVRAIKQRAEGSGLGAAGGAILGGLLGNQIGSGSGRKVATVAGAVGGAVVGNQVEGNMKATTHYEVRVRMDDGKVRTINSSAANWQPGDPVKVVKGRLQRR